MAVARMQVIADGAVQQEPVTLDPWQFQTVCTRWRISPNAVGPTIRHLLRQTGQAKCV
ncbi:hypothetical protein [Streptomyces sp. NPDC017958]|uniref:hypothetical protein n=1 Tax=Streptomyces sp. NPDC017958 TaxID=3365021 RepID=UPI0037918C55